MRKESGHPISYRNIDVIDFAKKKKEYTPNSEILKYINTFWTNLISVNVGFINIKDQQM